MKSQMESMLENPEFRKELAVESLVLEATETVSRLMDERKVTKADLARMMGKSRAWVTQLLNGQANMTLRTLAEVLVALDAEARIQAKPAIWSAGKTLPSGTARTTNVKFQMEGQVIAARKPEELFKVLANAKEAVEPLSDDDGSNDLRPEYAA